ncbi:hypothetical protein EJ04DRAFT_261129 [Polyplosphaeria fusca]|uniref:Uncharacterized protein n=1 Tax=Polyplosphaeria fusca TaxID=682080 RepID=A0A9P4V7U3_9PLEO|nr:hypothetical protein EJ04DRAFT_261129 [Polyplosphaeria fusca]
MEASREPSRGSQHLTRSARTCLCDDGRERCRFQDCLSSVCPRQPPANASLSDPLESHQELKIYCCQRCPKPLSPCSHLPRPPLLKGAWIPAIPRDWPPSRCPVSGRRSHKPLPFGVRSSERDQGTFERPASACEARGASYPPILRFSFVRHHSLKHVHFSPLPLLSDILDHYLRLFALSRTLLSFSTKHS